MTIVTLNNDKNLHCVVNSRVWGRSCFPPSTTFLRFHTTDSRIHVFRGSEQFFCFIYKDTYDQIFFCSKMYLFWYQCAYGRKWEGRSSFLKNYLNLWHKTPLDITLPVLPRPSFANSKSMKCTTSIHEKHSRENQKKMQQ